MTEITVICSQTLLCHLVSISYTFSLMAIVHSLSIETPLPLPPPPEPPPLPLTEGLAVPLPGPSVPAGISQEPGLRDSS